MSRIKPYYELKFFITLKQMIELEKSISQFCIPDKNGIAGAYDILSIYFDTPHLKFYHDKINGEFSKRKIRLRAYRPGEGSWHSPTLEQKERNGNLVSKTSSTLNLSEIENFATNLDLNERLKQFKLLLKPTTTVFYRRKAWMSPENFGFRLTFDQGFASFSPQLLNDLASINMSAISMMQKQPIIFEIKSYTGIPQSIIQLLQNLQIEQISYSKYATAIQHQFFQSRPSFSSSL